MSLDSFQERRDAAIKAEQVVEKFFQQRNQPYQIISPEKYVSDPATDALRYAIKLLANGTEEEKRHAKFLKEYRFLPDLAAPLGAKMALVEVKRSMFVEREAYEHYLWLHEHHKRKVIIAQVLGNRVNFHSIEKIKFTSDDWKPGYGGSGLPCKMIDLSDTSRYTSFVVPRD